MAKKSEQLRNSREELKKFSEEFFNFKALDSAKKNLDEKDYTNPQEQHPWNVVTETEFKNRMQTLFRMVANTLIKTVGPYGASTLIERLGSYHLTKDGFTVLKHIHFDNRTDNTIMNLILTISHQMVMKVGDGSTSAILAAQAFMDWLRGSPLASMRSKDLNDMITRLVKDLCELIYRSAIHVDDNNYVDVVEKVARVATNDNETYTKFIKEIYEKCGRGVTITKTLSSTSEASYEIRDDMYYINGHYLDKIYCNTEHGEKCVLESPIILMFDFTLEDKHWSLIQMFMQQLNSLYPENRVLVIAPHYDQYFNDRIRGDVIRFREHYNKNMRQDGAVPYPIVFASSPFIRKNIDHYIYDDLTAFLGNNVINPVSSEEFLEKTRKYVASLTKDREAQIAYNDAVVAAQREGRDPAEIPVPVVDDSSANIFKETTEAFLSFIGQCDKVSIGDKTIEFTGFSHKDPAMLELRQRDAKGMLDKELEQIENLRYVGKEYIMAKERMARISCQSAIISVGGNTELDKAMNMDALDDAISACESAVQYGYYYGNNLAIFKAIFQELAKVDADSDEYGILELLALAFMDVALAIYKNKYPDFKLTDAAGIITEALKKEKCYDLNIDDYSEDIINSVQTDIEILKGAISIVGTILSANQYIAGEIK